MYYISAQSPWLFSKSKVKDQMFLLVDMPDETQLNKAIVVGTTFLVDYMSVEQQSINI